MTAFPHSIDYFNDPALNGKYLGTITKDFVAAFASACNGLRGFTTHAVALHSGQPG